MIQGVRGGVLYRFARQSDLGGLGPSLAVRTTVQVPVSSAQTDPALRADLLASWDLSNGWWGHMNAGYQIVPGGQPELQAPGRNSVSYGRIGFVKALGSSFGLIVSGTFSATTVGGPPGYAGSGADVRHQAGLDCDGRCRR